ncbi:DUF6958 family protein [Roseicyclus persicicus]|uniref:DUF3253 domain-containing protein n=1 Tax=Roseicyclus persicicus TaxID=2650661 RepID=A0A7X6JZK2_9RHOB|nr:hypothetical protein [Roseibacterium persicicum]NKX45265.1 hypothetical protein [Roseibacterium persicicum]
MDRDQTVDCRGPEGAVTPIAAWKVEMLRKAILHAVDRAGPGGLPLAELAGAVRARLSAGDLARLGALGWHCTAVRHEMEAAGEIVAARDGGAPRLRRS